MPVLPESRSPRLGNPSSHVTVNGGWYKTSLERYSDADIDDVIWNLNATPRKCLGYRTPIEAFAANLGVALGK
jgi:hypothetical protein